MLKRILCLVLFFLLPAGLHTQENLPNDQFSRLENNPELQKKLSRRIPKPRELSTEAKHSLESRGFKVLDTAPMLISPRMDSLETEQEIVRVAVSFNLSASGIKPIYRNPAAYRSSAQAAGDTIMADGFEGDFPGMTWQRSGEPTWGKTNYQKHSGGSSVWCATDSTKGVPAGSNYPNNCGAAMIFGPFDLSDVNYAQLKFWRWMDTEHKKDWLSYMASTDGNVFQGYTLTGTGGWGEEILHLSNLPELGDATGQSQVWIAFIFESDGNATAHKGAFVDDVLLTKRQVAGTPIAGALAGTLTPTGNPYIAVGNVGVLEADSLRIEPGVEIRFDEGTGFIVLGSFYSVGTPTDSIVFSSNTRNPKPTDWAGISFCNSGPARLEYSRIEYARDAISSYDVLNKLKPLISNSLISKNWRGVFLDSGDITLSDDSITLNQNVGIDIASLGTALIQGTSISNNEKWGIYNFTGNLRLINCRVENNGETGIQLDGYFGGNNVLRGNLIKANRYSGVKMNTSMTADFINNTIIDNKAGIEIIERYNDFKGIINNNCFIHNGIGVDLKISGNRGGHGWGPIMHNIFYSDSIGIQFEIAVENSNVLYNDFYGNTLNFSGSLPDSLGILTYVNDRGDSCDKFYNIFLDPLFVDPHNDDYHLAYIENGYLMNSPCRNAGINNTIYNDVFDGSIADIGNYGGSNLSVEFVTKYGTPIATSFPTYIGYKFEKIPINFSSTTVLSIKNNRSDALTINSIRISDNINFSVSEIESLTINPSSKIDLTIGFNPINIGVFSTDLIIESNNFYGSNSSIIKFEGESFNGTAVKGNISGIWEKSNSPYIVYGDLDIRNLTIKPGVEIRIDGDYRINVSGSLKAIGALEDSIIITWNKPIEIHGQYIDAYCTSVTDSVILQFCRIEHIGKIIARDRTLIANSTIQHCKYNGIEIFGSSLINNNTIRNNGTVWGDGSGIGGGIKVWYGSPEINNNIIIYNKADYGGGIGFYSYIDPQKQLCSCNIINNTIYGNESDLEGGGLYAVGAPIVNTVNNILVGNMGKTNTQIYVDQHYLDFKPVVSVNFSCIQGGWEGAGNIDGAPLFLDPANNDFHLQPNSPGIDAGSDSIQYNDPEDINYPGYALYPALATVRNDMGAYGGPDAAGWIYSTNQPPSAAALLTPANGDTVFTTNPVLSWEAATDPDLGDKISYTLYYDTTKVFSQPDTISGLLDTKYVLSDSLVDRTRYFWTVAAIDKDSHVTASPDTFTFWVCLPDGVEDSARPVLPTEFALRQNYPNPFNPTTTIKYQLPEPSDVIIKVYSALGQVIRTLVAEKQMAGYYSIHWNGIDDWGKAVASGVYFYRIEAKHFVQVRKALFLK